MDQKSFLDTYTSPRNGADYYVKYGHLMVSSGVRELAETGCFWLLDVVATEFLPLAKRTPDLGIVYALVRDSKANVRIEFDDDVVAHAKHIPYTDLPDGEFKFLLQDSVFILLSEY